MYKPVLYILLFFIACYEGIAQRPSTAAWLSVQIPVNIGSGWQWHNDAGYRTLGKSISAYQYLYRTGIRYKWNEEWNTAAGIAFFFTRSSYLKTNDEFGKEIRSWEEINYQPRLGSSWQMINRLRMEQRFFSATLAKPAYNAYRFRLKSSLAGKLSKAWSFQLADEYMEQWHDRFSFDQNRAMASVIYKWENSDQLSGGYMWLQWPHHSAQHILTIGFQKNITIRANKS